MSNNSILISTGGHPDSRVETGNLTVRERELLAQAEAAKKQLEMVVNSVSDMFLMLNRELRYTYVNDRTLQTTGMSREQIEGRRLTEVFPDTAGTLLETELRRAIEQKVPLQFEYYHQASGRWFENRTYPTPEGLMLLTTEITERKKAAEVLRASEERFRALINCMHQQVWINDPEGRAIYVNDRWCEYISGLPRSQNSNWAEFIHAEDLAEIKKVRSEAMAAGEPYELQYRLRRRDGEYRWHVARVVPHSRADGSIEYWIGTATDIHDLKIAQEQLKRSEERFRMLVVTSSQCVWRHSADQTRQAGLQPDADQWWEEFTGQRAEMAGGWGWLEMVHPEDKERVRADFERTMREGRDYLIDYRVWRQDGEWRCLSVRGVPVREADGKVSEWVGTITDITDRRRAEDALRESEELLQSRAKHLEKLVQERTAKLQETIGDLEAFSYSISHDLRAPLRSMQGFAQALQEDYGNKVGLEGNDYLRRIASAASRMDRLIQDVLSFSRVSQVKLDMELVDVEKLIRGIVETYPNLQLSRVEIAMDCPIPKVMGNEAALTQCISNLLGNAVKFVKPGVKAKVRIWAEQNNNVVRLWFEDNGIGIPENAREKIFGIFQKLNKDHEGTGIGLAIVRKAAERMNGRVGVESHLGVGSRFWLELQRGKDFQDATSHVLEQNKSCLDPASKKKPFLIF